MHSKLSVQYLVTSVALVSISVIVLTLALGCSRQSDQQSAVVQEPDGEPSTNAKGNIPHQVQLRHPGIDGNALNNYTLYQVRNSNGIITGYTMGVDSVMCMGGDCKVVEVSIIWDALGEYEGYRLAEGAALEKVELPATDNAWGGGVETYKGTDFTDSDYKKLGRILRDKFSVLQSQTLIELTAVRDNSGMDAVTGATPLSLQRAVVQGAALTCYHLWHWANGEVAEAARELTHHSCDESLLKSFLLSDKPNYVLFALEHLALHKYFDQESTRKAKDLLRDGDKQQTALCFAYLQESAQDENKFSAEMAELFAECNASGRIRLMGALDEAEDLSDTLLEEMGKVLGDMDSYYEVHLFLSLLEKHDYLSPSLLTLVSALLEDDNFFIARRAYWYLEKQAVDEDTANDIRIFREKSVKDGRILK